jgi:hypothetical protein
MRRAVTELLWLCILRKHERFATCRGLRVDATWGSKEPCLEDSNSYDKSKLKQEEDVASGAGGISLGLVPVRSRWSKESDLMKSSSQLIEE